MLFEIVERSAVICDPKVGLTWEKAEKLINLLGGRDG